VSLDARSWTDLDMALLAAEPVRMGVVSSIVGLGLEVSGLNASLGTVLEIGDEKIAAEVVAARRDTLHCMPLGPMDDIRVGDFVHSIGQAAYIPAGLGLLGRVLDGLGQPIDSLGPLGEHTLVPMEHQAPAALERSRITTPLQLGVRAMDTLTAVGAGQRIGLFAGSGVGKSSLLSMIARGTSAQVNVIALVGERGREVREFLEEDLGAEGLARSIVVVSTADEPARMRLRAAFVATRIAESFRESGAQVLLMMDSLTRVAMAQREIGLSAGEPPATRGYPPSTFSLLARLLERAGTSAEGSITGIYTVLVDGDDHNEPIADATRSLLDGHIVLDRKLAISGHFPSIDALASVSRVASRVTTREQAAAAGTLRKVMAARRAVQDLLDVGAYQRGSNPLADAAVDNEAAINRFLQQRLEEPVPSARSWAELHSLLRNMGVS
jgi:flagellum-specific ATP synthase